MRLTGGMVVKAMAILALSLPTTVSAQSRTLPSTPTDWNVHLEIGPVSGFTTDWHSAPLATGAPLGATLRFRVHLRPDARVEWEGASLVERSVAYAVAESTLERSGSHRVSVRFTDPDGVWLRESIDLDVVPLGAAGISLSPIEVEASDLRIDESRPNESTMALYFGVGSIAGLTEVGPAHYRTSINRWLDLSVQVSPAAFEPLVEWTLNGRPQRALGSRIRMMVFPARSHVVAVDGGAATSQAQLDTYRVRIVEPDSRLTVENGESITFRAVTIPAGHEEDITWLASTKLGEAEPVTGTGPTFTTRFFDAYSSGTAWLGVKADHAKRGMDARNESCVCDLELTGGASDDTVCLSVDAECSVGRIEALDVFRNGTRIHRSARAGDRGIAVDFTNVCLDESSVAPGVHDYAVEAECRGGSLAVGAITAAVEPPLFALDGVTPDKGTYRAGDEVSLEIQARVPGLDVGADFSAVDSLYVRGSESVEDLGDGRYRIRHRIPVGSTRPSGDHEIPITAGIAGRPDETRELPFVLRYLPLGRGSWRLADGVFMATDADREVPTDPALRVDSMRLIAGESAESGGEPQLFGEEPALGGQETLRVTFSAPEPFPTQVAWLEAVEAGRSGTTRVPVGLGSPVGCVVGSCQYEVDLPLLHRDRSAAEGLQVRLRTSHPALGTSDDQFGEFSDFTLGPRCDDDPTTPEPRCLDPDTFRVSGRITYRQRLLTLGSKPNQAKPVQFGTSEIRHTVKGAEEVLVRVEDGCAGQTDGYTDSNGEYSIELTSFCGDRPATVTAFSMTRPVTGREVALGLHTAPTAPEKFADLKADPDDYTVIRGVVGTFTPAAGTDGHSTLDAFFDSSTPGPLKMDGKYGRDGEVARAFGLISHTLRALTYIDSLISAQRMPRINIVLVDDPLEGKDNTGIYSPSKSHMIHVPPAAESSEFVVVHETGHYFHNILGESLTDYGRFSEPMASVMAGMVNGTPWIVAFEGAAPETMDVQGFYKDGTLVNTSFFPLGTIDCSTAVPPVNTGNCAGLTFRIFWDLHDPGEGAPQGVPEPEDFGFGEFDFVNGGGASESPNMHVLNGVVMLWNLERRGDELGLGFAHPEYEDRGLPGMDLVDVLDGMACLYGVGELALRELLHDVMGYRDYEFDKCRGPVIDIP